MASGMDETHDIIRSNVALKSVAISDPILRHIIRQTRHWHAGVSMHGACMGPAGCQPSVRRDTISSVHSKQLVFMQHSS